MQLDIHTIRSDYNGFSSIAKLVTDSCKLWFDSVRLDFSRCDFFEANMGAPLYVVIAKLRDALNDVTIENLSEDTGRILKRNEFLSVFDMRVLQDTHQTTLPFKIFKRHANEQFNDYLETYMTGRGIPAMSSALAKRFRQSLFEIFLNAAIHSESESGIFVCGQFFPHKHRLDFTIADAGIGIVENVRRYTRQAEMDSCAAIRWALTEGNTTKTGNQPGGLGLKLIKDFIHMNKGKLQIISRFGYYEFSAQKDAICKMRDDFPGTCINIEINTQDTNSYCLLSELSNNNMF